MSEGIDLSDLKRRMDGAIAAFKSDIASLRTGRASANVLDPVMVEAYGSRVSAEPGCQYHGSGVPHAGRIRSGTSPWSTQLIVPSANRISGLNPIVDGQNLRIPLPELNEERRKSLVKVAHDYSEKAKIAVRNVRRDGMDSLKKAEKDGDIGQDVSRSQSEKVQKMTDEMISDIDRLLADKEKEIMQV